MSVAMIRNVGGGIELEDINPNKDTITDRSAPGWLALMGNSSGIIQQHYIQGYKKVALWVKYNTSTIQCYYAFMYEDGTIGSYSANIANNAWTDYIDIPSNAIALVTRTVYNYTQMSEIYANISLLTDK